MIKTVWTRGVVLLAMTLLAVPLARADWVPEDGHKMHFPQLPDPNGWDVRISNARNPLEWIVADDWRCSQTGPVDDVHLWVSWEGDMEDTLGIANIHLSIHDNIPAGPDGWSIPGNLLWQWDTGPFGFTIRHAGTGEQGWYDAQFDEAFERNHVNYYQVNIVDFPDPFIQIKDDIYWLDVSVDLGGESETGKLGWKTSRNHWMDDGVYWHVPTQRWVELRDPLTDESLDLAFVITPEPATLALLGMGATVLIRKRR